MRIGLAASMPINIETKNILTPFPPKPSAATAGPGHKPAIAHPIPNKTDPAIKSLLTFWLAGVGKFSANNGALFFEYQIGRAHV